MENIKKSFYEISDSELAEVAGGTALPDPKYPIGTPVLENEFSQDVGQDSGEVVAYGWYENGAYSYIVKWRMKGERKYSEREIDRLYMCWDLSR